MINPQEGYPQWNDKPPGRISESLQ